MPVENTYCIKSYVALKNGKAYRNGNLLYESNEKSFQNFSKSLYQHLAIDYVKFHKMDALSKLAFLSTELIFNHQKTVPNTALVFSNKAASLSIDRKHQQSIQNPEHFYPSPANFVYTLPNICLGEISIRHQLHSENSFFIFDAFDKDFFLAYATSLLADKKATEVLCGWVDVDKNTYEACLYLVSTEGKWEYTKETLTQILTT